MTYSLGVDLGTTYTAAAIRRDERLEIIELGTRNAAIPSVVYLRDDGTVLTGEAAQRRGATDPTRMSREFKRRMGDTTAILLGGAPYSVDALMASLLRAVVAAATERQGEPPAAIAIAHPANWGRYKLDLLDQAVQRADLDEHPGCRVALVTEPQAAAVHYASLERLDPDATVAVYDLGGGTFDVAVLRKTGDGFELLGDPEGIERLGGIDFDEAVFSHVGRAIGGALEGLDPDDPVAQAAVSRLREECVAAKEALSSDTEVSVPVLLPTVQTEVRLTRAEFEAMIRPALADTLIVVRRTLRSAGVEADDLHSVLLVGGSSRIPLISQMVGADLGRPVAVDIHPKHSVALGAATLAAALTDAHVATAPATTATPSPSAPVPVPSPAPTAVSEPTPQPAPAREPAAEQATEPVVQQPVEPEPIGVLDPVGTAPYEAPAMPVTATSRRRGRMMGGVAAAALVGAVGGFVLLRPGGGDTGNAAGPSTTLETSSNAPVSEPVTASTTSLTSTPTTTPITSPARTPITSPASSVTTPATVPVDPCADAGTEPCIVVEALRITDSGAVEVTWSPRNFVPDVAGGFHAHLYWNTATASQASTDAADRVPWDAVAETVHTSAEVLVLANRPPAATGVCATVGIAPAHTAYDPSRFHCLDLPAIPG